MTTINVDVAATGTQNGPFEPQQSFVQRLLNFQIALDSNPATAQPSMFDTPISMRTTPVVREPLASALSSFSLVMVR